MKGILFKPYVWAGKLQVLETNPTAVTRRLQGFNEINNNPEEWHLIEWKHRQIGGSVSGYFFAGNIGEIIVRPRYLTGDVVYIKEAWADMVCLASTEKGKGKGESNPLYKSTADSTELKILAGHWKSPMFMPEWAARYFIKIVSVRPERLQEITEDDALLEGVTRQMASYLGLSVSPSEEEFNLKNARRTYEKLWDSINKKMPWASNPWCWRIEFKLVLHP